MRMASLLTAIGCAAIGLLPDHSFGASATEKDPPFPVVMEKIADDVYAFVEPQVRGIVSGTVVAVLGKDSVLIFDTTHHVSSARRIIAQLKQLTTKPVRYIVNSHWHEDHWVGNAEFAAAYPGVTIVAHPFTAEIIEKRRESFRGEHCKQELRVELPPLQKELASGHREDGAAISEQGLRFRQSLVDELNAQISECDSMHYRGVDVTFADRATVSLGGRSVQLMHLGRGNTAGDVIAYLPDSKILVTGDVLVAPFPFATQSYIREWALVLDQLLDFDAAVIIPGHGPIMRDKNYLREVAGLMHAVSAQVHTLYRPGMSADDVRKQIDVKSFRDKIAGDDGFVGANFDNMILQSAVNRAVEEEQGALKPEG